MNAQRFAAILLIASFVSLMLSVLVNAPGLYATQNINERLQIISAYKTRWLFNQALAFLYILLTTIGFAVLASALRTPGKAWIPAAHTRAFIWVRKRWPTGFGWAGRCCSASPVCKIACQPGWVI
jgi:hypothetical protein